MILREPAAHTPLGLGFTYEGTLRQRYLVQGRFDDESHFGLLREEWSARSWIA